MKSKTTPLQKIESEVGRMSGFYMFEQSEIPDALASRGFTDVRQKLAGVTQFVGGRLPGR